MNLNRDLLLRLKFISMLSACSSRATQKEVSNAIGISRTTASKYINGAFLPSTKRAAELSEEISQMCSLEQLLKDALNSGVLPYPEALNATARNFSLVMWASLELAERVKELEFEKILTVEGGGAVVGSIIASLTNVELVYGLRNVYVEEGFVEKLSKGASKYSSFMAVPKGALAKGERLLIVDDVMFTGRTVSALENTAEGARCRVEGIAVLATRGSTGLRKFKDRKLFYLVSL
ncbi:adenine phosphoribosyltransferase [Sulfodiicoccus acidiphilus]|uniref:Adenine phosphoribosyltransferase n=1 Tax=Sulfodiicoccus acidiphilus TaxID=1670455 RepID=A0A348B662_9CREN|nr:phosphoribosyltransferase family protein [Sulfodiicoccus acidiphilus]BBD73664.1 adenine phosphoribosyltransferase [Sulfodiicoccus acidiphilus]GGU01969.1 adenine phosphoribosyltransferase [Sulfodiicoccus acidiphilus]